MLASVTPKPPGAPLGRRRPDRFANQTLELSQLVPYLHCGVATVVVFKCHAYPVYVSEPVRKSAHNWAYYTRHPRSLNIPRGCPGIKRYLQSGPQDCDAKSMLHFVTRRGHNRGTPQTSPSFFPPRGSQDRNIRRDRLSAVTRRL